MRFTGMISPLSKSAATVQFNMLLVCLCVFSNWWVCMGTAEHVCVSVCLDVGGAEHSDGSHCNAESWRVCKQALSVQPCEKLQYTGVKKDQLE